MASARIAFCLLAAGGLALGAFADAPAPKVPARQALATSLGEARKAYAALRDYSCHLVRQERIDGTVQVEQTAEVRARVRPYAVAVRVIKPVEMFGEETTYRADKSKTTVRHIGPGREATRGYQTLQLADAKLMRRTLHPANEVGVLALVERVEKMLDDEARAGNTPGVTASEYTFAGRTAARYELFCDRPHPLRYAAKSVVYFDAQTKLPVRFEAYQAPKLGETAGELTEVQSYVGFAFNQGLGDQVFDR